MLVFEFVRVAADRHRPPDEPATDDVHPAGVEYRPPSLSPSRAFDPLVPPWWSARERLTRLRSSSYRKPSPRRPSGLSPKSKLLSPRSAPGAAPLDLRIELPRHPRAFLLAGAIARTLEHVLHADGRVSVGRCNAIHCRGPAIRPVSCYTLGCMMTTSMSTYRLSVPPDALPGVRSATVWHLDAAFGSFRITERAYRAPPTRRLGSTRRDAVDAPTLRAPSQFVPGHVASWRRPS